MAGTASPTAEVERPPSTAELSLDAASGVGAGGTGAPLKYPPPFGMGDIAAGIAHLNEYRTAIGAGLVTLDEASSTGCQGHVDYLIEEQMKTGMVASPTTSRIMRTPTTRSPTSRRGCNRIYLGAEAAVATAANRSAAVSISGSTGSTTAGLSWSPG